MKKIIVISYYFPPCNRAPSQRVSGWVRYFHQNDIYPIIITRKWERDIKSLRDVSHCTSKGIEIVRENEFEVHYLPYNPLFKDRLYANYDNIVANNLRRVLSLVELIVQPIWWGITPYKIFTKYTERVINTGIDISAIVITGNPFQLFKIGYKINIKYKVPWIADYRDGWTNYSINDFRGKPLQWLINKWHQIFELKWVSNAAAITTVSAPLASSLSEYHGRSVDVIENGVDFIDFEGIKEEDTGTFMIAYIGTLYDGQPIELFLEAFKKFIADKEIGSVKLIFPGLSYFKDQSVRVCRVLAGFEGFFSISDRLPRSQILTIEHNAQLLLHVGWPHHRGIVGSKIYEYLGSGTPILVAPSDHGVLSKIIEETKAGYVSDNIEEILAILQSLFTAYCKGNEKRIIPSQVEKYTKSYQTKKLSLLIKHIINKA